jgi:hypothetical protein
MKMKRFLVAVAAIALLSACNETSNETISTDVVTNPATADNVDSKEDLPVMTFDTELQEFGTIVQGDKARMTFAFKNTGDTELIISSASGSCGCTVPDYPKTPISPGEEGVIEVLFDSKGKMGKQHKKVNIVANTNPSTNTIAISGNVVGPDNEQ